MLARVSFAGLLAAVLLCVAPLVAVAKPVRIAMLPVVVHSATGTSDYLSKGIADMLSARLETGGGVQVLRLSGEEVATTDPRQAVAAGASAGADFVVFGSFTQFGSGASLDVRCARVEPLDESGEPEVRRVFVQSGELSEIIPRLDDLSGRIVKYVKSGGEEEAEDEGGAPPPDGAAVAELQRRIEVLEEAVFRAPEAAPAADAPEGAAAAAE